MWTEPICADVLDWCATYDGPAFHGMLCDPPYELGFMGKDWDKRGVSFQPETWAALAAHLLPGAHVLAFGGSRTHHRLMCAMEDAGLEIRDSLVWVYASGFPKSLDVSKAIDKAAGETRKVVGEKPRVGGGRATHNQHEGYQRPWMDEPGAKNKVWQITTPATPGAATWEGYGTALKPAVEVIVLARKPVEGTIAENCQRYGAGALNIDGTRIGTDQLAAHGGGINGNGRKYGNGQGIPAIERGVNLHAGRWPANLILDNSEAVAGLFPVTTSGTSGPYQRNPEQRENWRMGSNGHQGDTGSAARFFFQAGWELDQAEQLDAADVLKYCAKASTAEREMRLEGLEFQRSKRNHHPTVKPLTLCRYLATLLLPPAAYAPRRMLVPFAGVGSEMIGALLAGWDEVTGIEQSAEYCRIAEARLAWWLRQPVLLRM